MFRVRDICKSCGKEDYYCLVYCSSILCRLCMFKKLMSGEINNDLL